FGPSQQAPAFSYFSVDLASAYSSKISSYVRTFCFLNLEDEHTPAALVVLDNMETSTPAIQKYWQVNTLHTPKKTEGGLLLTSSKAGKTGYVVLNMLGPAAGERK